MRANNKLGASKQRFWETSSLRELPYTCMTSAVGGGIGGGPQKADKRHEVARILYASRFHPLNLIRKEMSVIRPRSVKGVPSGLRPWVDSEFCC